ncbi:cellulose biosynthesis protein BcsG [Halopseudomonas phragmitis]|uniref:Cellulose biosynthesis protein BcsG n=1 Tax=Halopseudomonas phragmitis TaxID=1931241 RepID=A0A1V0B712_9GAMM|nr:cellulose biosynthesis protein BcsG [Halopseudomonas phragmitis]AQZ95726.1 cellulose biosynthesis protein BcsG [Halopseudomonas phragmitis]
MSNYELPAVAAQSESSWTGLGLWNLYFLLKLVLYWLGYLNLQLLPNLAFAAFLLFPLGWRPLRILRTLIAIPIGVALFYQDTWFPPFSRLLEQPGVLDFSWMYMLELLERFINWQLSALILVMLVVYLYLQHWVRLTTFTVLGLGWLSLQQFTDFTPFNQPVLAQIPGTELATLTQPGQAPRAEPDTPTLNSYLQDFYNREAERFIDFSEVATPAEPFDLLLLNVCSLAWDDLSAAGLKENRLFEQMDVIFDNFNSATAYSGPAAIRLLRAGCGQSSHERLYASTPEQCFLMDQLRQLGFNNNVLLNHNGQFDNFIGDVRAQGNLPEPQLDTAGMQRAVVSFDSSPIWRDREVLARWWQQRENRADESVALFYNTTTLHDGNRMVLPNGSTRRADYQELANTLVNDLAAFIQQLERSGRRIVVMIVPEHGANLHGDRMQISGMREIPSQAITHVPVAIKFIGMDIEARNQPARIGGQSSYLALAEIIHRLHAAGPDSPLAWDSLLADLPETPWVAENSGTVVLEYDGKPYVRIKENGTWLPYPARFP